MATLKSISLPKFDSDYQYLVTLDSQEGAVREGLAFYKALAMLLNQDMVFSPEKGSFVQGRKEASISAICKANGWSKSSVSKAATVIHNLVNGYQDMDAAELREQVIALVTNHGSVNAAYNTIVPPKDKGERAQATPKTPRELVQIALRRFLSDNGTTDGFVALVNDVVATWEADQDKGGDDGE